MKRLISLVLILALALTACTLPPDTSADLPLDPDVQSQIPPVQPPEPDPGPEPDPEPEPEPVVAHLMVAGDVMSHMPVTRDAYVAATDSYDYGHMLQFAAQQLEGADYAVTNLETVLAGGPNYSGFPNFNSPDELAFDLRTAGFDLVSTANNHTRDQGINGIFRTLDVLDQADLAHVGTYRTQEERDENNGIYVADVGGISVAFLCYTYGLNGYQISSEYKYCVNLFNLDYYTTLANPDYDLLRADMEAARALETDLIAVMIHWGVEYQNKPNSYQTSMAEFLVGQGADLVLGGHSHVLQPYTTVTAEGWDGQEREGFVCYSLGNFISNQYFDDSNKDLATRTTAVLDLELTRDPYTGQTTVTDVCYTPYFMVHLDSNPIGQRRYLVNIHDAMAEYEAGESAIVTKSIYNRLQQALDHCHQILGEEGDRPAGQAVTAPEDSIEPAA